MSGGGLSNIASQVGAAQPVQQATQQPTQQLQFPTAMAQAQAQAPAPQWQTSAPNTGWNQPVFSTNPNTVSPTQNWWTNTEMGKSQGGQEGLNTTLRNQIQAAMGNYQGMVDYSNQIGISQQDIKNAIGGNTDMYTYMNRPNYQQYSPNGQFNPTIYQSNYQNYSMSNPMGVSQYGMNPNVYAPQMSTPFNPYTNSYQSPFSYQQPAARLSSGPSQAIVGRSSSLRGTPNVVARRAEGGITSLMDDE